MLNFLGFNNNSNSLEDFISNFKKIEKINKKLSEINKKGIDNIFTFVIS